MPWNDADELVVAQNGGAFFAPVGTALPTTPTAALNAAFVGAGFISEDGAKINVSPDIVEHRAWQSRQPVRRDLNGQDIQATFDMEQWNENNVPLAFGGGEISEPSEGVFRYDFPEDDAALDERALVIDAVDGEFTHRFVFPRGNVTEAVEAQFSRSTPAMLPITFKVLEPTTGGAPGYYLTDAPGFAAGS